MKRLQTLLDVSCPFCGAGVDEKCRVQATGRLLPTFHDRRRSSYKLKKSDERWREEWPNRHR